MVQTAPEPDVFAAVAEPRRREILELLTLGEMPVGEVVDVIGIAQPQVSKHLKALRNAGLVNMRPEGRRRLYSVNGERLKPVHDWAKTFERYWEHQLSRVKARAEASSGRAHKPNANEKGR